MENLPLEIADNILSRLPMVLKIQSREVSKTWQTFVPKPKRGLIYGVSHHNATEQEAQFYFSEQNNDKVADNYVGALTKLEHRIILPSSYSFQSFMVGSCHGLVCYASYDMSGRCERNIYICNPVTGEQIQFPVIYETYDTYIEQSIGFSYNRSRNEYKVVRTLHSFFWQQQTIQVYTIPHGGAGAKLRNITNKIEKFNKPRVGILPSVCVFAGGALYWIDKYSLIPETIVGFDLKHETFESLPSIPSADSEANVGLMVLGGNLCVLDILFGKPVRIWELRIKKSSKHTQKHYKWRTKFTIAWEEWSWFEPGELTEGEKYFLWYNVVLSCYDPATKTLIKLEDTLKKFLEDGTHSVYTTTLATPFMHSLVPLKLNVEGGFRKKNSSLISKRKRNFDWQF